MFESPFGTACSFGELFLNSFHVSKRVLDRNERDIVCIAETEESIDGLVIEIHVDCARDVGVNKENLR